MKKQFFITLIMLMVASSPVFGMLNRAQCARRTMCSQAATLIVNSTKIARIAQSSQPLNMATGVGAAKLYVGHASDKQGAQLTMVELQKFKKELDQDPLAALGLTRNASPKEIKDVLKKITKKYHPDMFQITEEQKIAVEIMKSVNGLKDRSFYSDYVNPDINAYANAYRNQTQEDAQQEKEERENKQNMQKEWATWSKDQQEIFTDFDRVTVPIGLLPSMLTIIDDNISEVELIKKYPGLGKEFVQRVQEYIKVSNDCAEIRYQLLRTMVVPSVPYRLLNFFGLYHPVFGLSLSWFKIKSHFSDTDLKEKFMQRIEKYVDLMAEKRKISDGFESLVCWFGEERLMNTPRKDKEFSEKFPDFVQKRVIKPFLDKLDREAGKRIEHYADKHRKKDKTEF